MTQSLRDIQDSRVERMSRYTNAVIPAKLVLSIAKDEARAGIQRRGKASISLS